MADDKKPEEKKADEERAAAEAVTPRPDPVGERNYAMGAPIVRPEGEGTPGAMRQSAPPAASVPDPSPAAPQDAVTKAAPVGSPVVPVVPVAHPTTAARVPPGPPELRKTTKVAVPETPQRKK